MHVDWPKFNIPQYATSAEDKNLSHLEGKGAQENSDVLLHCLV